MKDGKVLYFVNGIDVQHSNWMRYVNCSRVEEEQNLVAYQYRGDIYYRAYKDIQAGELWLWILNWGTCCVQPWGEGWISDATKTLPPKLLKL